MTEAEAMKFVFGFAVVILTIGCGYGLLAKLADWLGGGYEVCPTFQPHEGYVSCPNSGACDTCDCGPNGD